MASTRDPHVAFAAAVDSLSADPSGENVVRYLLASRELQLAQDAARRAATSRSPDNESISKRRTRAPTVET